MASEKLITGFGYIAAVGAAVVAGQAGAQTMSSPIPVLPSDYPTERITVSDRFRPEYQSAGVRLGGFTVRPEVSGGVGYIDNVFGSAVDKASDFYAAINPSITLEQGGGAESRASINLGASASLRRFKDEKQANESAFQGVAGITLPFMGGNNYIAAGAGFRRSYERQESGSFPTAARSPIKYDDLTGYLRMSYGGSRIRAIVSADVTKDSFSDARLNNGTRVSQAFRDRTVLRGTGRLESSITGALAAYAEGRFSNINYDENFITTTLPNRDGDQAEGYLGLRVDAGKLRGIVSAGYTRRTFSAPLYRDFGGIAVDTQLTYFASGLTTFTLNGYRNINENGDPAAPAMFGTGARLRVDHELLRYIILTGNVGYDAYSYRGSNRDDKVATIGGGVRYLANRHFEVNGEVNYVKRTSRGTGFAPEFNRFQVLVNLVAKI